MSITADKYLSQLRHCIPVNSIVKEAYDRLKSEITITEYNNDQTIFEIGDEDSDSLFLLEGEIELFSKDGKQTTLSTEHKQSLYALAALKPRLFTAKANNKVFIARLNTKILDKLLIWEQSAAKNIDKGVEVNDIFFSFDENDSDIEWKMAMLQTQIFLTLPAANIMSLFDNMEAINVNKGQRVIQQGDPGDYYYIIKSGNCIVSRSFQHNKDPIILNKLGPTDCFGEEALVSGDPRNASITMKTDGILLRLAKDKFHSMLEEPLLHWVDSQQAKQLIKDGALPIDVRMEDEFAHSGITNTTNIPLYLLRLKIKNMDKSRRYVLFCDTGARSSAAAFLMTQAGFKKASILKGGLHPNLVKT
ncbi:MAG: cyclic nucleotide-binding domain-containing protein [Flavobacteriaceae bacterium]